WFNMALFAAGIALAQRSTFAASDWEIIKVSGHDYLSVDNISRFYGFPAGVAAAGEKSQLDAVKNPLEFVSGSREAMINGARRWLFCAVGSARKDRECRTQFDFREHSFQRDE